MLFQPDYLISWDLSADNDFTAVSITRLSADKKGTHIIADVLTVINDKCGVISLRQLLEEYERQKATEGGGSADDND